MRSRGLEWRVRRFNELTALCRDAAWRAVDDAHPETSQEHRDWIFLNAAYGREVADATVAERKRRGIYDDDTA